MTIVGQLFHDFKDLREDALITLGTVWSHAGTILEPFCDILGLFKNYCGIILGSFWVIMGSLWDYSGIISEDLGIISEAFFPIFDPPERQRLYQNDGKGLHGNVPEAFVSGQCLE